MRLYSAILTRNEAGLDRYLRRVLTRCAEFSDAVLVLDDNSTDDTAEIARQHGALVRTRQGDVPAWGAESSARQELWAFACEHATEPDDWVLVCDSDMLFEGAPRELIQSEAVNAWSVILYDAWSETAYREDGFWQGHLHPRPWLYAPNRVPPGWVPEWNARGLHTGHAPENFPYSIGIAPLDRWFYIHLAYSTPYLRRIKHQQYMSKAHLLSEFEIAHANSILSTDAPGD